MTPRRQRVRIRARGVTLQEEPAKPVRTKPRQRPKPSPPPEPEIPQPDERALQAKDLVSIDDILKNPVLTPDEVGTLLRVSPTTVMKLVQDGDIPAMKMNKETRMLRIDVLRFIRDLRDRDERIRRYKAENRH